jgi:phosphatidylglycerol:prolipoprotein diacylglycerol transferase
MPLATITLAFDPVVRLGDLELRAATVLIAGILLAGLLLAARIGSLTPQPGPYVPSPTLRLDDIPFLVIGIVAGAVIGGRLEYVLLHADYYRANLAAIPDPAQGSLALAFGVVGGMLGGIAIARLVGAPAGRWMHAAILPLLFVLAAGKLAMVLAADGQGLPSDLGWATAYAGPGPWGSLAVDVPSHPSQVYEALGATLVLAVVGLSLHLGAFAGKDGSAMLVGVALWALVRSLVVFSWRDAPVAGSLRAEHLVLAVVVGGCIGGLLRLRWKRRST